VPEPALPAIFAVIPAFDAAEQTLRCLRSLACGDVVPTAIVVDHGPHDSRATIEREFPDAVVLRGDDSMWWAGATNVGVRHALARGADYVMTFNCDGTVDRATVRALLAHAQRHDRVIAGAVQMYMDRPERIYNAGVRFGATRRDWFAMPPLDRARQDHLEIDCIGCNCVLIPRAAFDAIGLFDEQRLPQTWSDFDFQLRAAAAGWSVHCVAAAAVWVDLSTTGLVIDRQTGVRRAAMLLTSWRSPYNLRHLPRFVLRHAPRRIAAAKLVDFYRPLASAVVRHHGRAVKGALRRRRAAWRRGGSPT
jgi:GT2 family glycosyltransferase